jgi:hypothetical protein
VFVPWFEIEIYTAPIEDKYRFIKTMSKEDWEMWKEGATLEGINWYHIHKSSENYDDWQMYNEFPTTSTEAFVAAGERYFAPKLVLKARKNNIPPARIADIHPTVCTCKADIKESEFVDAPKGRVKIWKSPRDIVVKGNELFKVMNRYCAFADIGGTSDGADFSSVTVIDRLQMYYGGWPEVAARWHGHLDQDLFAWAAVQLAYMYDKCLLAVESNSLTKEKASGDHFLTILDTIADHYDNLYIRNEFERIDKDWTPKYGFHTNKGTKDMILSKLRAGLRDDQFVEREKEACDEFDWFERKKDGTVGAIDGKNDDIVISTAGAYWMSMTDKVMGPVKLIPYVEPQDRKSKNRGRGRTTSEATLP